MSILAELHKINAEHFTTAIFSFVAVVAPGVLITYHFRPEWILQLDVAKLLLFGATFSMPLVMLNLVFLKFFALEFNINRKESSNIILSLIMTSLVLYPALLYSYVYKFSFMKFLIAVALLTVFALFVERSSLKEQQKQQPDK